MDTINRADKKSKWTVMKYVKVANLSYPLMQIYYFFQKQQRFGKVDSDLKRKGRLTAALLFSSLKYVHTHV